MLLEKNVVGKKTDWANYITLADEHETPMLRLLPKGPKPVNVIKNYQSDTYAAPKPNAWPDGKDWDAFKSAGANRKPLQARVQWFVQTAAVSKLAEDVTDTAGITDELAHEIPKKMTEMAREMECAAGSDQSSVADAGDQVNGNQFRGAGAWIKATANSDADQAVDASILPDAAQLYTDTKANLTEDAIKVCLETAWLKTGGDAVKTGIVGSKLKKQFGIFQFYIPTSLTTIATNRVSNREQSDGTLLGSMVDVYNSDWGNIELHMSRWLAHENFGGSVTKATWRGYFFNATRWAWLWNQKPTVYKPEFKGGSYKAAMDAILMFLCWNPVGEIKIDPSDA